MIPDNEANVCELRHPHGTSHYFSVYITLPGSSSKPVSSLSNPSHDSPTRCLNIEAPFNRTQLTEQNDLQTNRRLLSLLALMNNLFFFRCISLDAFAKALDLQENAE